MLKLRDLATRSDFQVGPLFVSPSRRRVRGPAGELHLEPLIMQVFLLLLDRDGKVVTRYELFDQCWGGVVVGDDSLNRAIAKVRRISEVAPGLVEIETIPRTGYRLTGEIVELLQAPGKQSDVPGGRGLSRRVVVGSAAAALAVAGAGGAGLWWSDRRQTDLRFEALMARGDEAFRSGDAFEPFAKGASGPFTDIYEEAVRLEPENARAWGLLAYFRAVKADQARPGESARHVEDAQDAIRRAVAINRKEPNALTAKFLLEGPMLDWAARDRRLREIVAIDPVTIPPMSELMALLQAAGLTRESWRWNEKILQLAPLSRPHLAIRSMKLWILGDIAASDQVIDRVRGLWPHDPFGYQTRLMLFALTDRPQAALTMLDSAPQRIGLSPDSAVWRAALKALDAGKPADIDDAVAACLEAARKSPWMVNRIVMLLGALGKTEAAFDVTHGFLLWRGNVVSADQSNGKIVNDYSRKMTQWLFTPPLATMRADPRFLSLCEEFGLGAYWRARHVKPDYLIT